MPMSNVDSVHNYNGRTASYPVWMGFIFVFNLVVGTGALTLPAIFAQAGWLLSSIVIILLAVISYMTATFVIEAMACANAVKNWQHLQFFNERDNNDDDDNNSSDDSQPLLTNNDDQTRLAQRVKHLITNQTPNSDSDTLDAAHSIHLYYKIDKKFELGEMASIFFNDSGRVLFYLCIATYLYGDLSIYSAAVAKSLRDIVCSPKNSSIPANITRYNFADTQHDDWTTPCWPEHTISRLQMYRIFVIGFTLIFGPFTYFSVQKTKYLQICTAAFRAIAFTAMITISIKMLITKGVAGHPPTANINGIPPLFGACIYSFMCHHSLPSLLAPISEKHKIRATLSYDYILICAFYIILALSGAFAFAQLQDLYTLNFIPTPLTEKTFEAVLLLIIEYFLSLFPVFTLSTSYPIIAITLKNNLQTLFLDMSRFSSYNYCTRRVIFPLLAIVPPFIITYFTESITSLVAFTGSYAGAGIQYIIPISLVYFARQTCSELLGNGVINAFRSPFQNKYWLLFILFWTMICICLVTVNIFMGMK